MRKKTYLFIFYFIFGYIVWIFCEYFKCVGGLGGWGIVFFFTKKKTCSYVCVYIAKYDM